MTICRFSVPLLLLLSACQEPTIEEDSARLDELESRLAAAEGRIDELEDSRDALSRQVETQASSQPDFFEQNRRRREERQAEAERQNLERRVQQMERDQINRDLLENF